jgi:hypothetical protein
MAIFALRVEDRPEVRQWIDATWQRGKHLPVSMNPYVWRFRTIKKKENLLVVCEAKPLIFNFSVGGWIAGLGIVFIVGYHWILWPCVFVGMLGYFWTSDFFYQMSRLALKKVKYEGSIKRVKMDDVVREVVL